MPASGLGRDACHVELMTQLPGAGCAGSGRVESVKSRNGKPTSSQAALTLDGVTKTFGKGGNTVRALDGVSLALEAGSFVAIMGPSGSGKTTLLQVAAGLDRPDTGSVHL